MLVLSRELLAGLESLRQLGADKVNEISTKLPPVMLRTEELFEALRDSDVQGVGNISRALQHLGMLTVQVAPQEVAKDVEHALAARWSAEDLAAWRTVQPAFAKLLASPGLLTLAKAIRLQYDHTNILTGTHVITDVRPVFDRDATAPVGAVICHTLRLAYRDSGAERHLTLALDSPDLRRLIDDATRALKKGEALGRYLSDPQKLPAIVAGDE